MALHLPLQHGGVLGPFGFFDPRSHHRPRYFIPHAYSLQIWVRFFFGLERIGRQRVV